MRLYRVIMASFAVFAIGGTASAAVIEVTANGVVDNGVDGAGLFGASASDLAGQPYSLTFDIDTSKGYVRGGDQIYIYTSVLYSRGPDPAITGDIAVNGVDYAVDGLRGGRNDYFADGRNSLNDLQQDVFSANSELSLYDGFSPIYPSGPRADFPAVFHDPNLDPQSFSLDYRQFRPPLGNFSFSRSGVSTNLVLQLCQLDYDVLSTTGGPTSFVPEPASWAMFVGGFATVGGAMRRRGRSPRQRDPRLSPTTAQWLQPV